MNITNPMQLASKGIQAISLLAVSVLFGAAAALLPFWLVLAILFLPIMIMIATSKPVWAAMILLLISSGLIPEKFTPTLPFLGGAIRSADLLLAILIFLYFARAALIKSTEKANPVLIPIYFYLGIAAISVALAFGIFNNQPKYIAYEARVVIYWFFALVVAQSIRRKQDLDTAVALILVVSAALSIAVIVQSITGWQLLSLARVEVLDNAGVVDTSITRSTYGGFQNFAIFSMVVVLAKISNKTIKNIVAVPLLILFSTGLIVTFGRGVWAASILAVIVLAGMMGMKGAIRIGLIGLLASTLLLAGAFVIRPHLIEAVSARVLSINRDLDGGESWRWRQDENSFAIRKIAKYPVTGIGLGGEYQPIRNRLMSPEQTRMMHNSYLYIILKFGALGILFPIWFTLAVWLESRRLSKISATSVDRSLAMAIGASLWVPVLTGFTQPEWMEHTGVLFLATLAGLLIALAKLSKKSEFDLKIAAVDTSFQKKHGDQKGYA